MLHKNIKKWLKHWNTNTKNIIADVNNIIVSGYGAGTGTPPTDTTDYTANTIPPYFEPEQYPAPAAEVTPQAFRDQKTSMVGQQVLRGRQESPSSTNYTAGRTPRNPKNRKYGNRVTLLTGSTV